MYLEYLGLSEKPFENTPDTKFFYGSKCHTEALAHVLGGLINKGCGLLVGENGCGKTMLARKVIESLDPTQYEIAYIAYPIFSSNEFLREMMFQFGIDAETGTRREMFDRFATFGYENLQKGKQNVFMLDEAHLTENDEIFEQLRLLLNLHLQGKRLISVLLLGQPELAKRLAASPQFEQRIDIRERVHPLDSDDVVAYIRHRLRVAGVTRDVFTPEGYGRMAKLSQGIPRRINDIGERCLVEACRSKAELIDESIVEKVPMPPM